MADNIDEIRKIFRDKDVPLGSNDVWAVQGVAVVKHKALERLAAKMDIEWREPKIIRCERDEAVVLVIGALGAHMEWSFGEALVKTKGSTGVGNYQVSGNQAAYVWAIAEKRGKDRVIIKLAGIDAYSDEESDDFSRGREQQEDRTPTPSSDELYFKQALARIAGFSNSAELAEWYKSETETRRRLLDEGQIEKLFRACQDKRKALRAPVAASEAA